MKPVKAQTETVTQNRPEVSGPQNSSNPIDCCDFDRWMKKRSQVPTEQCRLTKRRTTAALFSSPSPSSFFPSPFFYFFFVLHCLYRRRSALYRSLEFFVFFYPAFKSGSPASFFLYTRFAVPQILKADTNITNNNNKNKKLEEFMLWVQSNYITFQPICNIFLNHNILHSIVS